MTYDYEVTLIGQTFEEDEIGNQIPVETKMAILCDKKSASRSEFYNAAAAGLRPEFVLVVHAYEYSGEQVVEFEGSRYRVIRTYATGFEELELTCERVIGNG
ncbi:phage head closure protein [Paenibacillus ehimensis]|uniref:Phage head closure protein n=1 Tax=Paenibacillus ehimensis TaxID=79264 RepID=A0ABT8VHV8_9BACL|nr:phage head closure protein [Paenibacillus ehimensis]MDO3680563.1 phage head closure protein [Paenibacillus ehimensis]